MRIGDASNTNATIIGLDARQTALANLQQQLSAGKKILRPSDDPVGTASAERAQTRLDRIQADRNALVNQRSSLQQAESTLGDATTVLQSARDLIVSAGNPALSASDRASIAAQLTDIRSQLLGLANTTDSNGVALFGGMGTNGAAFVDGATGVQYSGGSGQAQPTSTSVPQSFDGQRLWMDVPSGNGVFSATPAASNTGSVWTDQGQVQNPASVTGHSYQIVFSTAGANTTWSVNDTTAGTTVLSNQPYVAGQTIQFDGLGLIAKGTPKAGDSITVAPSTRGDIFSVLGSAAQAISAGASNLPGALSQSITQLDTGMERLSTGRSLAGSWLNRADAIDSQQQDQTLQQQQVKSQAEDLDMARGISDLQSTQTGLDAALKSYSQIQKLSLFNYIN